MHIPDYEILERDGLPLGWVRLMDCSGQSLVLSVVDHRSFYYVLSEDAVEDVNRTQEASFATVAHRVAGALLHGAWIDGYEVPEDWFMSIQLAFRPRRGDRSEGAETIAAEQTSVAAWLVRRGWSVYEAARRTAFSESSLRRWREGYKMVEGDRVEVVVPAYAERMIELVDELLERGAQVGRWTPCQHDASAFSEWVDRRPGSQGRAAALLGTSRSQISAWVNGRAEVPTYISRMVGLIEMRERAVRTGSSDAGAGTAGDRDTSTKLTS